MSTILLSIKPEYSKRIFDGVKKYEYRKHLARHNVSRIIVYSTAPVGKVLGEVEVVGTLSMSKSRLWEITKKEAGISRLKFREYFRESKAACAYVLGKTKLYKEPKDLDEFGIKQAPQSFVYLKECPYCKEVILTKCAKKDAIVSNSVEHIIPLSLGNEELVLDKGIICDRCNNYFAREIEKPFLELETIKLLRTYHSIPSRKNKIPSINILFNDEIANIEFDSKKNCAYIGLSPRSIIKMHEKALPTIFSPGIDINTLKDNYVVSRFLVKIFTEMVLFYTIQYSGKSVDHFFIVLDKKMDQLFQYVRKGDKNKKIFTYTVEVTKELIPFTNDDFIASVTLNFDDDSRCLSGMTLRLFELEFKLTI